MKKTILEEALDDVKLLEEAAIKNARNVLVEAISPQIKEFVNSYVSGGGNLSEMPEGLESISPEDLQKLLSFLKMHVDGAGEDMGDGEHDDMNHEPSDGAPMGDSNFGNYDSEEEDMTAEEGMYENKDEDEKDDELDETVNIEEADLRRAWAEIVQESTVSEGEVPHTETSAEFDDAENPNKNAVGGLGEPGAPGERGLEDKEKEEMWKDHEAPGSSDWTVKEAAYKKHLSFLQSKVNKLNNENKGLNAGVQKLKRSLTEVNLFNSKLLFTNKLLQKTGLTNEQRLNVIETFDQAQSMREVELVYKSLSESFKIAGVLSESKHRTSKKAKSSRFATSATANMLRERSEREEPADAQTELAEHMQRLAGLNTLVD